MSVLDIILVKAVKSSSLSSIINNGCVMFSFIKKLLQSKVKSRAFGVYRFYPDFATVTFDGAEYCYQAFCERGIAVRLLDDKSGLRFGLPGEEHDWVRLEQALQSIMSTVHPLYFESGEPA